MHWDPWKGHSLAGMPCGWWRMGPISRLGWTEGSQFVGLCGSLLQISPAGASCHPHPRMEREQQIPGVSGSGSVTEVMDSQFCVLPQAGNHRGCWPCPGCEEPPLPSRPPIYDVV